MVSSSQVGCLVGKYPEGFPQIPHSQLWLSANSWQELVLFAKYDVERAVWLDFLFVYIFFVVPMKVSWKDWNCFVLTFVGLFFFLCFDILVGMGLSFIPCLLAWKIWPRFFFMRSQCFSLFLCSMMNGELKLFANFPLPCWFSGGYTVCSNCWSSQIWHTVLKITFKSISKMGYLSFVGGYCTCFFYKLQLFR